MEAVAPSLLPRFARTKIQPPRPRAGALIARDTLELRLTEALLRQRLVLVSAPAGYGKTAALTRQLDALPPGTAVAWVGCDAGDDLHRLLECLVAALEPYDLPWRTDPEALIAAAGRAGAATGRPVVAEIINTLDACDVPHGVMVFDDLHRVDDPAWFAFLDLLLERLSPRWTVAVAARADPPLALARLRAMGELAEFRLADLAFGREEVQALAAASGVPPEVGEVLLERTQGWAVGLRLALSTERGRRPGEPLRWPAFDRHVFEFLATEVLEPLRPELRDFLLRCSVLPELTAHRCAAVSGNPHAAQLLEEVDRLGLFATVLEAAEPGSPLTLQLHDLFREALEQRLAREHPAELPSLLQRAAAGEGDPLRRILLLLRADDAAQAAEVLLRTAPAMITSGALATVARLVEQFAPDWAERSPVLHHVRGLLAWAQWNFVGMVDAMQRAEALYAERGDADGAQAAAAYESIAHSALGRIDLAGPRLADLRRSAMKPATRIVVLVACLWHALDLASTQRVGPLMDELMDLVERSGDLSLWYRAYPIARINGLPGTARALDRYVEGALRLTEGRPSALRALALVQRGWRESWAGRLDAARESLALAEADSHWLGDPPNARGSLLLLAASLHALRGERAEALAAAQACIDEQPAGRGDWSLWGAVFYAARVAALCEALPVLRQRLAQLQALRPGGGTQPTHAPLVQAMHGHVAWLEGRIDDAVAVWERALAQEPLLDRLGFGIELRLRLAAAQCAQGRLDDAAATVRPVFAPVHDHAGVGGVLFARAALPALGQAPWAGRLDGAEVSQLRGWLALAPMGPAPAPLAFAPYTPVAPPPADAGLSGREWEVLERIAEGDSNKLIARAFDLSPHTVKRHVANILDKLGVDSRGQAAAWFREHSA